MFPICWETMRQYDIVLCSAGHYNMFMRSCSLRWSRVIFDEADSIGIPACCQPNSEFVWFVTSSLNNLLFCNGYYWKIENQCITRMVTTGIVRHGYIKNTFKSLETVDQREVLKSVIIKMHDEYIDSYNPLAPIQHNVIICQTPYYLKVLHDIIPENAKELLHGNDLTYAMQMLGFPVDSTENIISYVSRQLRMKKSNLEKKLQYLSNLEFENEAQEVTKSNKLHQTYFERDKVDKQLSKICQVIRSVDLEEVQHVCPICLEDTKTNFVVHTCCLNVFCEECVHQVLSRNIHRCPLCRDVLTVHSIVKTANTILMYKNDILKNMLTTMAQTEGKKVVVFYKRDASVQHLLSELQVAYRVLNGNNVTIVKTLEWFTKTSHNILFVNVELYACGLNLIQTTDIIFYQRMSIEMENQLIGRAYRIGRNPTISLMVHHLLHHEE